MTRALVLSPPELLPRIEEALAIVGAEFSVRYDLERLIASLLAGPDALAVIAVPPVAGDVARVIRDWGATNLLFVLLPGHTARIVALAAGADDAQPPDIDPRELAARIEALQRRSRPPASDEIDLPGGARFDPSRALVVRGGSEVRLTKSQARVLAVLVARPDMPTLRDSIAFSLYGGADAAQKKVVDVFICKLRSKIMGLTGVDPFETIWGDGYRFCPNGRPDVRGAA